MDFLEIMLTILFGIFTFILFLIFHVLVWRMVNPKCKGPQLLAILAVGSYLLSLIIHWLYCSEINIRHYAALPLFAVLVMLYSHLYVGVDRSVSIRILGELYQASQGKLDLDQLKSRYSGEHMIEHRVKLMCAEKWLVKKDDRFYCTNKAIWLARITLAIKKFYRLEDTG